ncbi:hypothetical protein LI90_2626 [Carbonactinospora thermoautotrophica]|uniref:Uncharacterized protein n=1 Tax=Carbonactinospora thermoautotrophica TaxID=1469144 RepID=A0A132MUW8_9ACTN|nr:hypothetical protein LI90_2626 [Carbonactinospora thermoautotrophica]
MTGVVTGVLARRESGTRPRLVGESGSLLGGSGAGWRLGFAWRQVS